jgi:hypothetical protein
MGRRGRETVNAVWPLLPRTRLTQNTLQRQWTPLLVAARGRDALGVQPFGDLPEGRAILALRAGCTSLAPGGSLEGDGAARPAYAFPQEPGSSVRQLVKGAVGAMVVVLVLTSKDARSAIP